MGEFTGWNDWFLFRKRISLFRRMHAMPCALLSLPINYVMMSSPWLDPSKPVLGIDPLLFIGVSLFGTATVGYLIGSSLPIGYLRFWKPHLYHEYNDRLRTFYYKVVKHRANVPADPSKFTQSVDFYGEKISSLSDFRQWLKKHQSIQKDRTFNL